MIRFEAEGKPVAQGNHRASRSGYIYETSKGHADWREEVRWEAYHAAFVVGSLKEAIAGPVKLSIEFRFRRPSTHLKKDGETLRKGKPVAKTSSPDLSKLVRCVEDAITDAGIWKDDALVVEIDARKSWTLLEPGITVWIEEL